MSDVLTRFITRLADRRCPDCGTRQPLYVAGSRDSRVAFVRGEAHVVPCPGCGLPLRLLESPRDPQGIVAAIVFTVGGTAALFGVIGLTIRFGWSGAVLGILLAASVILMVMLGIAWNLMRTRSRVLVRTPAPPARPLQQSERRA
jgi:hypothetical protein